MSVKVPLALFSSGLDSTYMLLCLLSTSDIDVLCVTSNALPPEQQKAEAVAREAILKLIDRYVKDGTIPHRIRKVYRITIDLEVDFANDRDSKFAQPKYWLFAAMQAVKPALHSSVMVGYVMGDQVNPYLTTIKQAWKTLWKFSMQGKCISLKFPLMFVSKRGMVEYFKNSPLKSIYDQVHWCEYPIKVKKLYKPCETCESCRRMSEFTKE